MATHQKVRSQEIRKILCVDWDDASSREGWEHVNDLASAKPVRCRTIGFVMNETKGRLVLAQNLSLEHLSGSEIMTIPKSLIKKRRRLKL